MAAENGKGGYTPETPAAETPKPNGAAGAPAPGKTNGAATTPTTVLTATNAPAGETPAAAGETPAGETPAAEAAAGETPAGETPAAAAEGPPETYTLALPEGTMLDAASVGEVEALARARGMTNEAAQALLNEHSSAVALQSAKYLSELMADPELGGAHLAETQLLARQALEKFAPAGTPHGDNVRALLNRTGAGNSKDVIKVFADMGRAMKEDGALGLPSTRTTPAVRDPAKVLYGG